MKTNHTDPYRRKFLAKSATLAASTVFLNSISEALALHDNPNEKMKIALVGLGVRGTNMFGRDVKRVYDEQIEFVGLCDINPGRLEHGKKYIGVECPLYEWRAGKLFPDHLLSL